MGAEIFGNMNEIGMSKIFTYVIYSVNSMNKLIRCIKKMPFKNLDELKEKMTKDGGRYALYH